MASGWKSEGGGFESLHLQAIFDLGLSQHHIQPKRALNKKIFARHTFKEFKKLSKADRLGSPDN